MPPPQLPLELFLMVARSLIDEHGECCYADLNSLLRVNRVLYDFLNPMLWQEATQHEVTTQRTLTHLIRTNDLGRLEFFLELGADVETALPAFYMNNGEIEEPSRRPEEPTPLIVTTYKDNVPMVRLLLKKGAKVQYSGDEAPRYSAIHVARSAEMVQLLLDHHADPDLPARHHRRPLHFYAIRNDIAAMRAVLQSGAEVDPLGPEMWMRTPLHEAARRSDGLEAVILLLEFGANVQKRGLRLITPLHFAARTGSIDVVRVLLERWPAGLKAKDHSGYTPLHFAIHQKEIDVMKLFVESWPEGVREKNIDSNTPLHLAARDGNIDALKLLVDCWPEGMRDMGQAGSTPLHLGASRGQADVVRLLSELCPESMQAKNPCDETPLHLAAWSGCIDAVRILVGRWPEGVREKTVLWNTPLHLAASRGRVEVVRLLVESWPEGKEATNLSGRKPLHLVFPNRTRPLGVQKEVITLLGGVY